MSPPPEQAAPQPVQGRKKKPALIGAAVAVILGGAGLAAKLRSGSPAEADASEPVVERPSEPTIVTLEPFILNLADQEDDRYLRATVRILLVGSAHEAEAPEGEAAEGESLEQARLRDKILTVLSSKHAEEIMTFEGKEELRSELFTEIVALYPEDEVRDVLFTEFLIQ